ncbi:MAG: MBL fold metallo-hydrolase, partial [Clostridiales bacterium]|nr:MBL fold metallo-hydrolase [Clostridiales bacterium]
MREEWKTAAIENYKKSYNKQWKNVFEQLRSKEYEHHMWMLGPSSYVFSTNGVRWGIDLQFRMPWIAETVKDVLVDDLATLDFIILTHEHSDHLDYSLLSMLNDLPIKWLIPAFFNRDKILDTGISPHRINWIES